MILVVEEVVVPAFMEDISNIPVSPGSMNINPIGYASVIMYLERATYAK